MTKLNIETEFSPNGPRKSTVTLTHKNEKIKIFGRVGSLGFSKNRIEVITSTYKQALRISEFPQFLETNFGIPLVQGEAIADEVLHFYS